MKVLLVFPQADGRTGVYIKKAFKNLGWQIAIADPKIERASAIAQKCEDIKPDLTFCSRTPSLSAISNLLKKHSGKLAMWNVDVRNDVNHWKDLFPLMRDCDLFFTVGGEDLYHKAGFKNCRWLPQGIDPDVHKPIKPTQEQMNKYGCDILFVGTYGSDPWKGRKEFLDKLLAQKKYSVKIFGSRSPQGLPYLKEVEANIAYNCAKVNVGFSACSGVKKSMSVRNWKILATGRVLFTRAFEDYHIILNGVRIAVFQGYESFITNVEKGLNKNTGGVVQPANIITIKEQHTYTNRIKKALEMLNEKDS